MDDFGQKMSLSRTKISVLAHEYQILHIQYPKIHAVSEEMHYFCFGKLLV